MPTFVDCINFCIKFTGVINTTKNNHVLSPQLVYTYRSLTSSNA